MTFHEQEEIQRYHRRYRDSRFYSQFHRSFPAVGEYRSAYPANPAPDNIHTWLRSEADIHSFKEVIVDYDPAPDYTAAIMKFAADYGVIKV